MFADRLKSLRLSHGLTQKELLIILKQKYGFPLSTTSISQFENGVRSPSIQLIYVLADYFGCSAEYLLGFTDEQINSCISNDDIRSQILGKTVIYLNSLTDDELSSFYFKNIPH